MKVLMFGWEYPPHVFGGLATARRCSVCLIRLVMRVSMPAVSWP